MGSRDLQEVRSSRRGRLVGGGEAFPVSKQTREALVTKPITRKELHRVALTTPGTGQGCPQLSAGRALLEGSVGRGGGWSASELTHVAVGGARAARPVGFCTSGGGGGREASEPQCRVQGRAHRLLSGASRHRRVSVSAEPPAREGGGTGGPAGHLGGCLP